MIPFCHVDGSSAKSLNCNPTPTLNETKVSSSRFFPFGTNFRTSIVSLVFRFCCTNPRTSSSDAFGLNPDRYNQSLLSLVFLFASGIITLGSISLVPSVTEGSGKFRVSTELIIISSSIRGRFRVLEVVVFPFFPQCVLVLQLEFAAE